MLANQLVEVIVTDQQIVDELRKRLDVKGYKIINGIVHKQVRVYYNEYEYIADTNVSNSVKANVEVVDALITQLNLKNKKNH